MDAEIAALEQRRDTSRVLKEGMMRELLSGRIRLVPGSHPHDASDIEASVEAAT